MKWDHFQVGKGPININRKYGNFTSTFIIYFPNLSFIWYLFISVLSTADNIRRTLQDVNLGCDDAPFVLPSEVAQNIRAIVASMPRNWGFEGLVRGRIIEGRRFPPFFPTFISAMPASSSFILARSSLGV